MNTVWFVSKTRPRLKFTFVVDYFRYVCKSIIPSFFNIKEHIAAAFLSLTCRQYRILLSLQASVYLGFRKQIIADLSSGFPALTQQRGSFIRCTANDGAASMI